MYPKFWLDDVQFLRCVADGQTDRRTDGQTDRRKKWHIDVGAPPKTTWIIKILKKWKKLLELLSVFDILPFFALLHPPNNPENQNFEKTKETALGDIIIFHKCTIHDNYMIYGSWDMKCTKQNFFVILDHFLPFCLPALTAWKSRILKKWKKA